MKTLSISSYFVLILYLQSCLLGASAKISYDGLVLSTIKYRCIKPEGEQKRVEFYESGGMENCCTAVFLKNITQINDIDKDGERLFEADLVDYEMAVQTINDSSVLTEDGEKQGEGKPLFCIHGFNVHPGSHLKNCQKNAENFVKERKFMLVPVIWPSMGDLTKYPDDKELAKAAGQAFKNAYKGFGNFTSKSLLAHSMGNVVLRYASESIKDASESNKDASESNNAYKFDNIFMVAADVPHDLFHKSYIESSPEEDETKHGLNLADMLSLDNNKKPKGKIYILHNGADFALIASVVANWKARLGAFGYGKKFTLGGWREKKKLVHPDITEEHIENIDFNPYLSFNKKASHGYQFSSKAVKIYRDKHI